MPKLLPEGLNDPSMFDVTPGNLAEAMDDGECEHCFKLITGKQRFYSVRRHRMELCSSCAFKKKNGELSDPKEDIESENIMHEYGEDVDLPF